MKTLELLKLAETTISSLKEEVDSLKAQLEKNKKALQLSFMLYYNNIIPIEMIEKKYEELINKTFEELKIIEQAMEYARHEKSAFHLSNIPEVSTLSPEDRFLQNLLD